MNRMIAALARQEKREYKEKMAHTDISFDSWIDRVLPAPLRPYARLARLDRPIGTWLLLLPCWWGLALASHEWRDLGYALLFAIGAVVMRGAGCVINDIWDRDFDRRVERTRARPLASGELSFNQALLFLVVLLLIGLCVLLAFNLFTVKLGMSSLLLVISYPLMKRITWWPQAVLGIVFNWGALMGWSAVQGGVDTPAILAYLAGIFWTLGYDTIYAHQDKRDDAHVGLKSLALRLGERSRRWVGWFYGVALLLFTFAGYAASLGVAFYAAIIAAALHAAWQVRSWHMDDPENCLKRFRSNRDLGLILLAGLLLGEII